MSSVGGKEWPTVSDRAESPQLPQTKISVDNGVVVVRLGIDSARIPPDLRAQILSIAAPLPGKDILIVLDNTATANQVTPPLPGDFSCTVLMNSRQTLTGLITGHGASHLRLECLTPDEPGDLLTVRLDSTGSCLAQLPACSRSAVRDLTEPVGQQVEAHGAVGTPGVGWTLIPPQSDAQVRSLSRVWRPTGDERRRGAQDRRHSSRRRRLVHAR